MRKPRNRLFRKKMRDGKSNFIERPFLMLRRPRYIDVFFYMSLGIYAIKAAYMLDVLMRCYFGIIDCIKHVYGGVVWYLPIECSSYDFSLYSDRYVEVETIGKMAEMKGLVYVYKPTRYTAYLRPTDKFIMLWHDRYSYTLFFELCSNIAHSEDKIVRYWAARDGAINSFVAM